MFQNELKRTALRAVPDNLKIWVLAEFTVQFVQYNRDEM